MYPIVICSGRGLVEGTNTCRRCAERNFIRQLLRQAYREGVHSACFARWTHRKYRDIHITRTLFDGSPGISLPCVLCRKILDRFSIQWRAHIGDTWVRSTDLDIPKSRPTHRQRLEMKFKY